MLIDGSSQVTISHTNIYGNEARYVSALSENFLPTPPPVGRNLRQPTA